MVRLGGAARFAGCKHPSAKVQQLCPLTLSSIFRQICCYLTAISQACILGDVLHMRCMHIMSGMSVNVPYHPYYGHRLGHNKSSHVIDWILRCVVRLLGLHAEYVVSCWILDPHLSRHRMF